MDKACLALIQPTPGGPLPRDSRQTWFGLIEQEASGGCLIQWPGKAKGGSLPHL